MITSERVSQVQSARTKINTLGKAAMVELIGNDNGKHFPIYHKRGVLNINSGKVCNIVSNHYKIIDHKDFFNACLNCANAFDPGFEFIMHQNNFGDAVVADLFYPHRRIQDDSADGLWMGFRLTNSYNSTKAASVILFGYRSYCQNGSVLDFTKTDQFFQKHIGNLDFLKENLVSFFDRATNRYDDIQRLINKAIGTEVDDLEETIKKFFPREWSEEAQKKGEDQQFMLKRIAEVTRKEAKDNPVNLYNLYNGITSFATHNSRSVERETYMQEKAKKVLNFALIQ